MVGLWWLLLLILLLVLGHVSQAKTFRLSALLRELCIWAGLC